MKKVLVTDGHSRASLQLVRSLGKLGLEVYISETYKLNPSFYSNYVTGTHIYPSPTDELAFIKSLKSFCDEKKIDIIFPVVDDCLLTIVKNRKELPNVLIPYTSYENLLLFRDKEKTMKRCKKLNLPHPETYFSKDNLSDLSENLKYPLIIKPNIGSGSRGIKLVKNSSDLKHFYQTVTKNYGPSLIQEFIPHGGAYGVELLFDSSGLISKFVHRRVREYPDSGGPSTSRISTSNELMEQISLKLVKDLNWIGPIMVEFRVDPRDNIPKIMEVNARYWGSLRCSIAAGVDFPKNHFLSAAGARISLEKYKLNICARWEVGEFMWILFSKGNFLSKFLKVLRGLSKDKFDHITKKDPLPFIISLIEAMSYLFSKKGRQHSINRGW